MIPYFEVLKKYGVFKGRARVWEYWGFWIANMFVYVGIFMLGIVITDGDDQIVAVLLGLYYLAIYVPGIAVTVRRLHDRGHSGWWYFLFFVPFFGALILLWWLIGDGQPGPNRYGPNPLETADATTVRDAGPSRERATTRRTKSDFGLGDVQSREELDYSRFFLKLPNKVYHAFGGNIEAYSRKKLSFACGCGSEHSVLNSVALVDAGLENTGIYVCPFNKYIFNVIKPTGKFRITGLKNHGYLRAQDEAGWQRIMAELESRKRRNRAPKRT